MILVDTSIWIEFLRRVPVIFFRMNEHLQEGHILTLECIFAELFQGCHDPVERGHIQEYWQNLPRVSQNGLWIEAGIQSQVNSWKNKGVSLIDATIIVAARQSGSQIWSLDKKLLKVLKSEEVYL